MALEQSRKVLMVVIKMGIRLYKLLFEAIYWITIRELEVSVLPETDETSSLVVEVQKARESLSFETVHNLVNNNLIEYYLKSGDGDMAFWLDSFLEMVNLLLNIVHFQRTANWDGFMESIYKFLPYCFTMNRKNYSRNLSYYYLDMIDLKTRDNDA